MHTYVQIRDVERDGFKKNGIRDCKNANLGFSGFIEMNSGLRYFTGLVNLKYELSDHLLFSFVFRPSLGMQNQK